MKSTYTLVIDGEIIEVQRALKQSQIDSICKAIVENRDNEIVLYPFNFYDDEGTNHRPDPLEIDCKAYKVENIVTSIIRSWNSSVNTHQAIHLRSL